MWSKIKDQPAVGKMIAKYDQLPSRDQQALIFLVIAVLLAVLYFAVWAPASAFNDKAQASRENAGELLAWMQANEATIKRLGSAGSPDSGSANVDKPESGRELMTLEIGRASCRERGWSWGDGVSWEKARGAVSWGRESEERV